jgi:hypothetical protein
MELSRPTVSGSTAWGNSTVSRTGSTGTLRTPGLVLPVWFFSEDGVVGWFGIECPLVNIPSLDNAD